MIDLKPLEEICTLYYQLITGYRIHSISINEDGKLYPYNYYVNIHMFSHMRFGIEFEIRPLTPDSFPPAYDAKNVILYKMIEMLDKCGMSNNVSLWKRAKAWYYYKRHMNKLRVRSLK